MDFTRVTIGGTQARAELVLPDDEPLANLLPSILDLLKEPTDASGRSMVLTSVLGEQLDPARTLAEQDVLNGTILRVVRLDEAPPPPEVADVTELLATSGENRWDAWRPWGRTVIGSLAAAVAGFVLGLSASSATTWTSPAAYLALIALGVSAVAALIARIARWQPSAFVLAAAAAGLSGSAALVGSIAGALQGLNWLLVWAAGAGLITAIVAGVGFKRPGVAAGGVLGSALVLGWWLLAGMEGNSVLAPAVIAVTGALSLGLVPGIAVAVAGLTGLDDRAMQGEPVPHTRAARSVAGSFDALTSLTLGAAVPTAIAVTALISGTTPNQSEHSWVVALAIAVVVVMVSRSRVLPRLPQRVTLWSCALVPAIALLALVGQTSVGAVTVVAIAVILAATAIASLRVPEHLQARVRRLSGVIEMVAVLAMLPLLLAALGVFADLTEAF